MEFLILTGLSGAGKSKAVEMLEDIDFVCIDNMPPTLLPAFGQIVLKSPADSKFAVVSSLGRLQASVSANLQPLPQAFSPEPAALAWPPLSHLPKPQGLSQLQPHCHPPSSSVSASSPAPETL